VVAPWIILPASICATWLDVTEKYTPGVPPVVYNPVPVSNSIAGEAALDAVDTFNVDAFISSGSSDEQIGFARSC
jgi:hypothetical protein